MVLIMARERQRLNQNQDTIITITKDMAMDIEDIVDTMARERLSQNQDTIITITRDMATDIEDMVDTMARERLRPKQGTMDITITTTKDMDMVIMDELVSKAQTVSGVQ